LLLLFSAVLRPPRVPASSAFDPVGAKVWPFGADPFVPPLRHELSVDFIKSFPLLLNLPLHDSTLRHSIEDILVRELTHEKNRSAPRSKKVGLRRRKAAMSGYWRVILFAS